jgi:hypothetical protein
MRPDMTVLPIGAVVDFEFPEQHKRARLVVVGHSDGDGTLYMLAERPIAEPLDAKLYSMEYLVYALHAGWMAGHVPLSMIRDTGERVKVVAFEDTPESKNVLGPR